MTRKHFIYMATWIATETEPGSTQQNACIDLAIATGLHFNPRFDAARFRQYVVERSCRNHEAAIKRAVARYETAEDEELYGDLAEQIQRDREEQDVV